MTNENVLRLFAPLAAKALGDLPEGDVLEEIRIRSGQRTEIIAGSFRRTIDLTFGPSDILRILQNAAGQSLYAHEEETRNGFLTLPGGHRVGFAGRVHASGGHIESMDNYSSLNIRVARQLPGVGKSVLRLLQKGKGIASSLIVSPPGIGKTTLLRDLARLISDGGLKVAIVDERGELACMRDGIPMLDVGERTDVLDGAPKAEGMMMLIRSMSPEVIVTDEVGGSEDISSLAVAASCGTSVLASAHAGSLRGLMGRAFMEDLMEKRIFERIVFIQRQGDRIRASEVYDESLSPLEVAYA